MLTDFDKRLLNVIQSEIPLVERPFREVAKRLGTEEEIVIARLYELKKKSYIRRIGAFFDSASLGFVSTLIALQVEPDYLPQVAEAVNIYSGVTHNYEREGYYNLWFTLISPDMNEQTAVLAEISNLPGVKRVLDLPASSKYKVNVKFSLE
jgi:DNA-binding Lrp family transcriptional regulator